MFCQGLREDSYYCQHPVEALHLLNPPQRHRVSIADDNQKNPLSAKSQTITQSVTALELIVLVCEVYDDLIP